MTDLIRKIGLVLSDIHSGNELGLLSPGTFVDMEMPDGTIKKRELTLNPAQEYLNDTLEWVLQCTRHFAGEDEVVLIHNGDLTQGSDHGSVISPSQTVQEIIATRTLTRMLGGLPTCKTLRIIKGTDTHVFENGDSEAAVGRFMAAAIPELDVKTIYHDLLTMNGVVVDLSHHGPPPGRRSWLTGNEARYYLRSMMMQELMEGKQPARLVVRSHYHEYTKETVSMWIKDREVQSTIVITPSMCLTDSYARKVVKSPYRFSCGGLIFETINGRLTEVQPLIKTFDIRTRDTIEE
jgi:hypothetical protein